MILFQCGCLERAACVGTLDTQKKRESQLDSHATVRDVSLISPVEVRLTLIVKSSGPALPDFHVNVSPALLDFLSKLGTTMPGSRRRADSSV